MEFERTGTDDNLPEVTSYSKESAHASDSLPNTYPYQPNADVQITWGVMTKLNSPGTSVVVESFICNTDLTNYSNAVQVSANAVYQYALAELGRPADIEIHWAIKIDNPTAPTPPMGAWVQKKMSLDGHLSAGNINSVSDIQDPIIINIGLLAEAARYLPKS